MLLPLVLLIAAFLCFLIAAIGVNAGRINPTTLIGAGLACWTLSLFVERL